VSPREAEVLLWLTQGRSNHDIGVILGMSERTVKKHLEHIYAKLGVWNRTQAATKALAAELGSET
jgi:DNA-binding CsgD family transcriptional regulator